MEEIGHLNMEDIWFSQREKVYQADIGQFSWTDDDQIWDWDQIITINIVRALEGKLRIVIRRKAVAEIRERDKNKPILGKTKNVDLRFMLGFEIKKVHEPETDYYIARKYSDESRKSGGKPKWDMIGPCERWFFKLDDNYWIWQKADKNKDIKSSDIYKIYNYLKREIEESRKFSKNIFELDVPCQEEAQHKKDVVPMIYQPSVDTMKNFVREVHCASLENGTIKEITLIFNNEQLRKHRWLNVVYEKIRRILYGRTRDIETFRILTGQNKNANGLDFTGIYSGNNTLEEDSIHGDPKNSNPPPHPIRYFTGKHDEPKFNQPVIFVNTSNHALAEHDTNPRLWKWEYIPWLENGAVKLGDKTREEINTEYESIFSKIKKLRL
jgi:hypothetical protein